MTSAPSTIGTDQPPAPVGPSRPAAALAGGAAAAVALGASELLAGLSSRIPSLVLGVADLVIAETPGGIVRWSIDTFGRAQKPMLVAGIVAVSLLVGAAAGILARRSFARGAAGFVLLGAVGGWAAARGTADDGWAWLAAAAAAGVGIAALAWLLGPRRSVAMAPPAASPVTMPSAGFDRRRLLVTAGALTALGALGGGIGRLLRQARNVEAARERLAARLGDAGPALPSGVQTFDADIQGVSPMVTPNSSFYRIDTRILVPQVDPEGWSLRITGLVEEQVELSFDDLLAMDRVSEYITLSCVSNEVGGDLVGNALWSGVRLGDLLDLARPLPTASQVVGRAVDGWTAGFPAEVVGDGRLCLVALAMNGEPLPVDHGFPARLVIPGLYGYVSATKWLSEIELATWDGFDAYWIPRGWAKEGPIKTQSRIDVPRSGATLPAGRTVVAGVAWAPTRSITRVEVSVDSGPWQPALLSGALSDDAWVQWRFDWDATAGRHALAVRATDGDGETQTADRAPPAPSGATGHHSIRVDVR